MLRRPQLLCRSGQSNASNSGCACCADEHVHRAVFWSSTRVGLPRVAADLLRRFVAADAVHAGSTLPETATCVARLALQTRRFAPQQVISRPRGAAFSRVVGVHGRIWQYAADVTMSLCICLRLQPRSTNSTASQSSMPGASVSAERAEVVGRADEAVAEVVLLQPVHHHARHQWVVLSVSQRALRAGRCSTPSGRERSTAPLPRNAGSPVEQVLRRAIVAALSRCTGGRLTAEVADSMTNGKAQAGGSTAASLSSSACASSCPPAVCQSSWSSAPWCWPLSATAAICHWYGVRFGRRVDAPEDFRPELPGSSCESPRA